MARVLRERESLGKSFGYLPRVPLITLLSP